MRWNERSTVGLRGEALRAVLYANQREWIDTCSANGVSYTGERGDAIRAADEAELHRLETEVLADLNRLGRERWSEVIRKGIDRRRKRRAACLR